VVTNRIPWDYNPEAYDDLTDTTLTKIACGDPAIRALLEESAGYCLFKRNELGKAFILTGTGSNGKSTFLNMLKNMLGHGNVSSLDLKKLSDRFSTVMLFGKLANIGDDISDEFLVDTSMFKKIVTGESIDAEQKGLHRR
jgi:putative DNA primase/helicase